MEKTIIKVGIPVSLLYHNYHILWEHFLNELGIEIIYSKETDNSLLEIGKSYAIDEACLPLKIYLGHIHYLIDKVDYILVPRITSLSKHSQSCSNFYALYDIVNNLFNTKIIHYNIDYNIGLNEKKAFIKMGKDLGFKHKEIIHAYKKALRIVKRNKRHRLIKQNKLLESSKLKILLAGHPYNLYDKLIGYPIVKILNQIDVEILYSDIYNEESNRYKEITPNLHWTYNQDIINAMMYYFDNIDGIIMITSFPCGPDSLTNEMCLRKINKPIINLVIDELSNEIILKKRIESFINSIKARVDNE